MNVADTLAIKRLQFSDFRCDPFEKIPEMGNLFYGIADELSLWVHRYGIRETQMRENGLTWLNPFILTFKLTRKDTGGPLSSYRYNSRFPERRDALRMRIPRVQEFVRRSRWFVNLMCRVDQHARGWVQKWKVPMKDFKTTNRWCSNGLVLIKMIPPRMGTYNMRQSMTHLKHDDL